MMYYGIITCCPRSFGLVMILPVHAKSNFVPLKLIKFLREILDCLACHKPGLRTSGS